MAKEEAFDHFMLFFSLDAWGEQAEYIRRGLNFEAAIKNIGQFLEGTEKTSITIVSTFNVFSVVGLKVFLKGVLELRKKYSTDRQKIWLDLPQLQSPEWMSIKILSSEYSRYIQECIDFVEVNLETADTRFKGFKDFELEKLKTLHAAILKNEENNVVSRLRKDFLKFFKEQDKRQNQNHRKVFPEMEEFFNLCERP